MRNIRESLFPRNGDADRNNRSQMRCNLSLEAQLADAHVNFRKGRVRWKGREFGVFCHLMPKEVCDHWETWKRILGDSRTIL